MIDNARANGGTDLINTLLLFGSDIGVQKPEASWARS
jgi:hypothetical protein